MEACEHIFYNGFCVNCNEEMPPLDLSEFDVPSAGDEKLDPPFGHSDFPDWHWGKRNQP